MPSWSSLEERPRRAGAEQALHPRRRRRSTLPSTWLRPETPQVEASRTSPAGKRRPFPRAPTYEREPHLLFGSQISRGWLRQPVTGSGESIPPARSYRSSRPMPGNGLASAACATVGGPVRLSPSIRAESVAPDRESADRSVRAVRSGFLRRAKDVARPARGAGGYYSPNAQPRWDCCFVACSRRERIFRRCDLYFDAVRSASC